MTRPLRWFDYITVNSYWLGLTTLSQTMTPLVLPLLIQSFVGEELKGTLYGQMRLWTLMVAVLVQALMGMLSDNNPSKLGRRRPFILAGSIGIILVVISVGFISSMEGMAGYWALFGLVILQMVFANTAHGAAQGLIPDVVPEEKRGIFSGIKAIMEVPVPVILVAFTIGRLIAAGNLWGALFVLIGSIVVSLILTMLVPEKQHIPERTGLDWQPFLRLLFMTIVFTVIILGSGQLVKLANNIAAHLETTPMVISFGVLGLLAMVIAVGAGTWISIRIGLGDEAHTNPSFSWWVINRLAFLVGTTNLASFTVYFFQGRLGLEHEKAAGPAATLTMFVGIFILLSALPSGALADRFGKKKLLIISGIMASVGTFVVISVANLPVIYFGGILIGLATGLFYAANWALGTEIVPKDKAGKYLGISNLAGAGAGAIGAYIGGPIADNITRYAPEFPGLGYMVLFVIYGILFLLSVIALRGIKEPSNDPSVITLT
ncbi:MAG: MFS transporter [Anaerolineae bacterium]|nr:MFS transporter [Anaerolineae bacterium]